MLLIACAGCDKPAQRNPGHDPRDSAAQPSVSIRFQVDDPKRKAEGPSAYVQLENPDEDLKGMRNAEEVVFRGTELVVVLDYPLRDEFRFTLTSSRPEGFTRAELVKKISELYKKVYEEEAQTSKVAVVPLKERKGLINRNETNGKYGIWGHDLGDLVLHEIEISRDADGKAVAMLGIDS